MRILWLFLAACSLSFAQLDSDTITISASGQAAVSQPDEISVYLNVSAAREFGLEEILKALAGLPVSEQSLTGVSDSGPIRACVPSAGGCSDTKPWTFTFTARLSKLNETLRVLASINAARQPGISIYYSFSSHTSGAAQECAYPTLISQARRHAENVAAAAGRRVGGILAMADGSGLADTNSVVPVMIAASRVGFANFLLGPSPAPSPACTAVVQFKLLR